MEICCDASEIIESRDLTSFKNNSPGSDIKMRYGEKGGKSPGYHFENEFRQLIAAIDKNIASGNSIPYKPCSGLAQKNTLKKPVTVGALSQASGTGLSESTSLKQALRRLCISQASEMAAMKRLSRSSGIIGTCEAATIKKLYASVLVQVGEPDPSQAKERGTLSEILPEAETIVSDSSQYISCPGEGSSDVESSMKEDACLSSEPSSLGFIGATVKVKDIASVTASEVVTLKGKHNLKYSATGNLQRSRKPIIIPRLVKPAFRNKISGRKRGNQEAISAHNSTSRSIRGNKGSGGPNKGKSAVQRDSIPPARNIGNARIKDNRRKKSTSSKKSKMANDSRFREKVECSQSSKSSIGDYSCSTSMSHDSHQNSYSSSGCRPHTSKDLRWVAIHQFVKHHGRLSLKNFKLLKKLGGGDIGTVYLAELIGSGCLFALKVMDMEFLISRKKMLRAQTEKDILEMLDHPFLPTLYAHFVTDNLACLVIEYCSGGDLHVLRQKQPGRFFTEPEARFYVAEVLLALEYLHMLGVIYRDLKPENILVREDGHIMLSDFDLSLRCSVSPVLLSSSSSLHPQEPATRVSKGPCIESSCIDPLCLRPSCVPVSCFTPRSASSTTKSNTDNRIGQLPQLVVEPTNARSNSFVGTHEYLAPEIIKGDGHGSAVDWWTFGIFLYELLFGRTPFKGSGNEETLANVVSNSLRFPECPDVSFYARDLIRALLSKEPENRLGYSRGAAEIKQHPFFEGLNWALIRCAVPPEVPRNYGASSTPTCLLGKKREGKCLEFRTNGEDNLVFELF